MLRFLLFAILIIVIARAFWRIVDGVVAGVTGRPWPAARPLRGVHMERDPVCGTFVVPDRGVSIADGARRVYFCSASCRDAYRARTA